MAYLPIAPWQHRMIGELIYGNSLGKTETMMKVYTPRIRMRNVEDPAQRDPPRPQHHDHLIKRHIRSVQRK